MSLIETDMKRNIITKGKKYLLLAILTIAVVGCKKDIFDQPDPNGVDPNIWNTPSAATLYINTLYDKVMPQWPSATGTHNSTDEFLNTYTTELYGLLQVDGEVDISGSSNTSFYYTMNTINVAIGGLENGSMDPGTRNVLKGQAYFFRAYMYFNMLKLYGGIPLVLKSLDLANDNLLIPRSKSSDCVKQIARDLDSCYALPASWPISSDGGRISRSVAKALKGKVLMYWASQQFNPGETASDTQDRWQTAYTACQAAYDQATTDGYKLNTSYTNIFLDETAANTERMMWRTYDAITVSPAHGTNLESQVRPVSETVGGGASYLPTWNLVQAYGTKDGLSITDPDALLPATGYDAELWWLNRDPRFAQSIAYNGCVWPLSGKAGRVQWNYVGMLDDATNPTKTGFYTRKLSNPTLSPTAALYNSNSGGGSGLDFIDMRFAEVLLNTAETANGLNTAAGFLKAQQLLVLLRSTRGIIAGNFNYGVAKITSRAQMFTELLREREVEFAMEGKRYDDLRRTRTFDKLTGTTRNSFLLAVKSPYVAGALPATPVAGKIYIDVPDPVTLVKPRDLINVNDRAQYEKYFTPPPATGVSLETTAATPVISYPTYFYFMPIPTAMINTSIVIAQTTGWPNGSFNPLL
jgi:hypothetical protein